MMTGHNGENVIQQIDIITPILIFVISLLTYVYGKYVGYRIGSERAITSTLDYLRENNYIRWRFDSNNELEILDLDEEQGL